MKSTIAFCLLITGCSFLSAQQFYDIQSVREVKVYLEHSDWLNALDSLKQLGDDDRVVGAVEIDGVRYDSVGVRFKGNSSYFNVRNQDHSKLPFNIKSDYIKDDQRFAGEYKSLKLSNVFRDPSFIREVLSYEIVGTYMHAPRANFVKLYVNDEYLGLYNNSESVDKKFLKENFGWKKGILFKCDPNWNAADITDCKKGDKASLEYLGRDSACYYGLYELKSDEGWSELIDLTHALNHRPERLDSMLQVDEVLWMHAFNNVLVNLDSYAGRLCHNYYLYRDSFNVWHPIVWDMNLSFGGFRYDGLGAPLSNEKLTNLSMFNHFKQNNDKRPLITNLLKNSLYRKIYVAHVKTIVEDYFANAKYLERAKSIQQTIDPYVEADKNKLYSYEGFKRNVSTTAAIGKSKMIGIEELMKPRTEYLTNHPLFTREVPMISNVRYIGETEKNIVKATIKGAENVYLMYRYQAFAPWQKMRMSNVDINNTFSAEIDKVKGTEYYIIAEGDKSASLHPARASYEFLTIE
jgi:hypothetical protein